MLMIRFQRIGRTNDPAFRIVVLEKQRAAKTGRIVMQVGTYNPKTKATTLKKEAIEAWLAKGAKPTGTVHNLFINKGILTGIKVNVLPKKTIPKKEEAVKESAPVETVSAEATQAA